MSAVEHADAVPQPNPATPQRRPFAEASEVTMVLYQIVLALVVLLVWQGSSGRIFDVFFVSNPVDVARRLYTWTVTGSIVLHIWGTVYATVAGFALGSVAGVLMGLWLGLSPFASRLLHPFIWAFNALPKVALAPLFILWFGLGIESKIALAAMLVLFIVFMNTYQGVKDVDQDLIDALRLMKGTRLQVLMKVIIPSSVSWIFTGFKIALPNALIGAVIGEMIASSYGLGYLVQLSGAQFDTAGVFAVLVVIGLLAVALNQIIQTAQSRLDRWRIVSR
jgi:NitT/TauT family transport system permease protein